MANDGNDILMQLRFDNGPLDAECQTEVNRDLDSFVSDYFNGTFFEIKDFSFEMSLSDQDAKSDRVGGVGSNGGMPNRTGPAGASRNAPANASGGGSTTKASSFARWKSAKPEEIQTMKCYPITMGELSVTRDYDKASPVLFKQCCISGSFKSASLIKRKDVGGRRLRGFLRLEFDDVLVTHLDWKNGESVEESLRFVFRRVNIRYRVTSFKAGAPEAVLTDLPPVEWSYKQELVDRQKSLPS